MLKELRGTRQIPGEPKRRCFFDTELDLTVWFNPQDQVTGFQLCYDKNASISHVLTWYESSGYTHDFLDDGENLSHHHKASPILIPDGHFFSQNIANQFKARGVDLEPSLFQFVYQKLLECEI